MSEYLETTVMVQESGGEVTREFSVLDVYRHNREFKPKGIAKLDQGGQQLAQKYSKELSAVRYEVKFMRTNYVNYHEHLEEHLAQLGRELPGPITGSARLHRKAVEEGACLGELSG